MDISKDISVLKAFISDSFSLRPGKKVSLNALMGMSYIIDDLLDKYENSPESVNDESFVNEVRKMAKRVREIADPAMGLEEAAKEKGVNADFSLIESFVQDKSFKIKDITKQEVGLHFLIGLYMKAKEVLDAVESNHEMVNSPSIKEQVSKIADTIRQIKS